MKKRNKREAEQSFDVVYSWFFRVLTENGFSAEDALGAIKQMKLEREKQKNRRRTMTEEK